MKRRDFLTTGVAAGTVGLFDPRTGTAQTISLQQFVLMRFCRGNPRLRRDAHALVAQDPEHPTLVAYATAVAAMKALPISDPTSWAYQAAIHGTGLGSGSWPPGAPFSTCNHGTSFLAWHRMYLFFFEKIVAKKAGAANFGLPYWNCSKLGQATIPAAFRQSTGPLAPLRDPTRNAALNGGGTLSAGTVSTATALAKGAYLGGTGFQSAVNGTPHGTVHGTVSGNMGAFNTAGLDPLFWLHHANIDRLWEAWLAQGAGQANPIADAAWMNASSTFADENGGLVVMANSDVLETVSQLRYQYDDPRDCIPLWILTAIDLKIRLRPIFELVLARRVALKISPEPVALRELSDLRMENVRPYLDRGDEKLRAELVFEGLSLTRPMQGYFEVWGRLALPERELRSEEPLPLGNLTTFGMDRASMASMREGGQPAEEMRAAMTQRLDVTDPVRKLFGSFDAEAAVLEVELRAVSGLEKDEADIARLNEGVEVTLGEVRIELLAEEG